jgi:undecaprenyl diphosphate synthase
MFRRIVQQAASAGRSISSSGVEPQSSTTTTNVLSPWSYSLDDDPSSPRHWLYYKNPDNFSVCPCPIDLQRYACNSQHYDSTDDSTVLRLVLRWSKVVAIKVARNYHAWPVVLVVIPLVIGFVVGFWAGRRRRPEERSTPQPHDAPPKSEPPVLGRRQRLGDYWQASRWYATATKAVAQHWIPKLFPSFTFCSNANARSDVGKQIVVPMPSTERCVTTICGSGNDDDGDEETRDELARQYLRSAEGTQPESGVDPSRVPRHVAVIMDGNRRYGRRYRGSATSGHYDGSRKLLQVAKWCIAERVQVLTVYAFSTENWNRDPSEVAALMTIFTKYCEELRTEAIERNIRVRVLSSEQERIPPHVKVGLDRLQNDTESCIGGLQMNICLSYGGRGEILGACQALAQRAARGELSPDSITEKEFQDELLTSHCPDPDVLIRTSGEYRLSNFLLWQLAYTELFFVDKNWPELEKGDFLRVIRSFADGRSRRFGQ